MLWHEPKPSGVRGITRCTAILSRKPFVKEDEREADAVDRFYLDGCVAARSIELLSLITQRSSTCEDLLSHFSSQPGQQTAARAMAGNCLALFLLDKSVGPNPSSSSIDCPSPYPISLLLFTPPFYITDPEGMFPDIARGACSVRRRLLNRLAAGWAQDCRTIGYV